MPCRMLTAKLLTDSGLNGEKTVKQRWGEPRRSDTFPASVLIYKLQPPPLPPQLIADVPYPPPFFLTPLLKHK